jgi:DNA-binding NarL/FixJ family response regulator
MQRIRILIADDHGLVRQGFWNVLSQYQDFQIVGEAMDGPSVFNGLSDLHPDCLLIDVTMPEFEPISAVKQIRADYPSMKILIVSAYDYDEYVKGLIAAGADGYHLKSQPLAELRLAIERVMAGEKWLSSPLVDKLVSPPATTIGESLPALTTRQCDLLELLQEGLDNQTIALRLNLSVKTVENNLTRLYRYLNIQSRLEAVNFVNHHPEALSLSTIPSISRKQAEDGISVHPINILLADDNARYRRELRQTINLVHPRAMIYEAENTAEAVHLAERVHPKLIFIDMILGKENGIQCTKLIRKQSPQARIVLISAYPDREFHRLGMEAGVVAFVDKKDLDRSALLQILGDNLD